MRPPTIWPYYSLLPSVRLSVIFLPISPDRKVMETPNLVATLPSAWRHLSLVYKSTVKVTVTDKNFDSATPCWSRIGPRASYSRPLYFSSWDVRFIIIIIYFAQIPGSTSVKRKQAVREAVTICPALCKSTFGLLSLKVVSESRVTWATSVPILVFPGLSVLD